MELQRAIEFEPSFHGLPFAASTLPSGRTLIDTKIFSIFSVNTTASQQLKHDRVEEAVE